MKRLAPGRSWRAVIGATLAFFGLSSSRRRPCAPWSKSTKVAESGLWRMHTVCLGGGSDRFVGQRRSGSWRVLLTATVFLLPVAVWLAVRWRLAAPVVALEGHGAFPHRRSGEPRTASLAPRRVAGRAERWDSSSSPALLGAILIFLTDTPLATLNIVAGVVYALSMPFVALATAYAYFDARTRVELEPVERVAELPAEISLESA